MTDCIKSLIELIKDAAFTVHCPYCNRVIERDKYACDECKKQFPETPVKTYAVGGFMNCSPFLYDGIFSKAVCRFKFNGKGALSKQLSVPMVMSILETYDVEKLDLITCVPMHKKAQNRRGYNQSELLARECSRLLNIPYASVLEKYKINSLQHESGAAKRAKNIRGVYRLTDKQLIKNKNILIIDDIITTGNTLGECARMLIKGNCSSVCCATVCTVLKR